MSRAVEALGWRLEALRQLLSYIAAALLAVALPLHLLEHVPVDWLRQPPRPWALWLVLLAAGFHGLNGLRGILLERVHGRRGRVAVEALFWLLLALVAAVGSAGLARSLGW